MAARALCRSRSRSSKASPPMMGRIAASRLLTASIQAACAVRYSSVRSSLPISLKPAERSRLR